MRSPCTNYFLETGGIQVQEQSPLLQARPELEEAVQGEGWYVWCTPSLPTILHLLLKLYPPARGDVLVRTECCAPGQAVLCPVPGNGICSLDLP